MYTEDVLLKEVIFGGKVGFNKRNDNYECLFCLGNTYVEGKGPSIYDAARSLLKNMGWPINN